MHDEKASLLRVALFGATLGGREVRLRQIGEVQISTGRLVACDPLVARNSVRGFAREVPRGAFPVLVVKTADIRASKL